MTLPAPVQTLTSQTRHVPYITIAQYKAAPTGVELGNLVPGGLPEQQDAQLASIIADACTWVDSVCMQVLAATTDTEQTQLFLNRYGQYIVHPRYFPILQLTDLWTGSAPNQLVESQDLSGCWVEPKKIVLYPTIGTLTSSAGPLQFGPAYGPRNFPFFVKFSYINGYPVTTLDTAIDTVGATTFTVVNPAGILPNFTPLTIQDGPYTENVTVTGITGSTITCLPLQYEHLAGVAVTALPGDVERAVIAATTGFIKLQGAGAVVTAAFGTTATASAGGKNDDTLGAGNDFALAEQILTRGDYIRTGVT